MDTWNFLLILCKSLIIFSLELPWILSNPLMGFSSLSLLSRLLLSPYRILAHTKLLRKFLMLNQKPPTDLRCESDSYQLDASKFSFQKRGNNHYLITFQSMKTRWSSSLISWSFLLLTLSKQQKQKPTSFHSLQKITFYSLIRNKPTITLIIKIKLQEWE